jgi:FkbM family methyltransferase
MAQPGERELAAPLHPAGPGVPGADTRSADDDPADTRPDDRRPHSRQTELPSADASPTPGGATDPNSDQSFDTLADGASTPPGNAADLSGALEAAATEIRGLRARVSDAETLRTAHAANVVRLARSGPGRLAVAWDRVRRRYPRAGRLARRLDAAARVAAQRAMASRSSPLFDEAWYETQLGDEAKVGKAWLHYQRFGRRAGLRPNAYFDERWYLGRYPDVAHAGVEPLDHYLRIGGFEGRDPGPEFDSDWYLERYPDAAASGQNPLAHHIRHGAAEGRQTHPSVTSFVSGEQLVAHLARSDLSVPDFAAAALWHRDSKTVPHDPDFNVFRHLGGPDEVFVDVGANIGNSVVSFRLLNPNARIVSFEPNVLLEAGLRALASVDERLDYHMVGLGDADEVHPLFVPCHNGTPNFYLASMDAARFTGLGQVRAMRQLMRMGPTDELGLCRIEVTVRTLDSFGLSPTILKIDTETWEAHVVRGGAQTISAHRPLVLIEGANRERAVDAFFGDLGYTFCDRVGDQVRPTAERSTADSGFFAPRERLDEYRARGIVVGDATS